MIKIITPFKINCDMIDDEDIDQMLSDGRFVSHIATKVLKNVFVDIQFPTKDQKYYDCFLSSKKCEIKGLTTSLKTAPSCMFGAGRGYDIVEHRKALLENKYYIIHHLCNNFIIYYVVESDESLLFKSKSKKDALVFLEKKIKKIINFEKGKKINMGVIENEL